MSYRKQWKKKEVVNELNVISDIIAFDSLMTIFLLQFLLTYMSFAIAYNILYHTFNYYKYYYYILVDHLKFI